MPELSQEHRFINISKLGSTEFVVMELEGHESVSSPFRYALQLASENVAVDAKDVLCKSVAISVKYGDDAKEKRYFHGLISSFSADRLVEFGEISVRLYEAEVVPWWWFTKINTNCRVFQEKTAPQIVEQVMKDSGYTDYKLSLKGTYAKQDYCIQYQESDYAFASRLMEQHGIFYYFLHDDKKHTMVMADAASGYADAAVSPINFDDADGAFQSIASWKRRYSTHVGKATLDDYDFESPATLVSATEKTKSKVGILKDSEQYEYAAGFLKVPDGKALALARIEEREADHQIIFGRSNIVDMAPGHKFKLAEHPVQAECGKYVTISVHHQATEPLFASASGGNQEAYSNAFECAPAEIPLRPRRLTPRPLMTGPQSAKVVGAKGQEILTDKYGRVKIQFPWDREGKYDDKSSCFVRVAQSWAGAKRGFQFTPRVGDEVLVEFMNGDPDRPIVTGSVYNADNMPPWTLPDDAHISGIKTLSTDKGKAKNFSELHFDDKIGKEKVYFHAERDFVRIVENDDTLKVGFDAKDKGDQIIDIYNDRTITIDKGNDTFLLKTGNRETTLDKGNDTVTIKMGNQVVNIKAGEQTTEAAKSITFKVGGSSIKIEPAGITIKSAKISVLADLKAEVKGTMVDIIGSAMTTVKGGLVKIN
jgi:type VI secretion system secreted protein VgrG